MTVWVVIWRNDGSIYAICTEEWLAQLYQDHNYLNLYYLPFKVEEEQRTYTPKRN